MQNKGKGKKGSVKDGLTGLWLRDVGTDLGSDTRVEFFLLWQRLATIALVPEQEDVLVWRWSGDDQYSSKSTYEAFFAGAVKAPVSAEIWRSRAPCNCKFFAWLDSKNRCWMEDRHDRWGLPCPLCDQE
jgi:hypothetical protein